MAVLIFASTAHAADSVYAPYAFLIGEWQITPEGSQVPMAVTRFRWGPGQSYLLLETSLIIEGKEEPHFEGMLVWNGVHKNLDMLLTMDSKSGRAQEQGTFNIARMERSCARLPEFSPKASRPSAKERSDPPA